MRLHDLICAVFGRLLADPGIGESMAAEQIETLIDAEARIRTERARAALARCTCICRWVAEARQALDYSSENPPTGGER